LISTLIGGLSTLANWILPLNQRIEPHSPKSRLAELGLINDRPSLDGLTVNISVAAVDEVHSCVALLFLVSLMADERLRVKQHCRVILILSASHESFSLLRPMESGALIFYAPLSMAPV